MGQSKLGRRQGARKALLRSQVAALIHHGRIETTETKAKAIRPLAERMITLGKRGDLASRRQAAAFLNEPEAVKRLFNELGPKYADRNGGYTRILKLGPRRGDAAPMSLIELVE